MLIQITPSEHHIFTKKLDQMHLHRGRVFKDRLEWEVRVKDGRERDQYDDLDPTYLLYIAPNGELKGSIRLLPTTNTNMLRDTFPQLLDGKPAPQGNQYWESSRFCVETKGDAKTNVKLSLGCVELFAGMIEFGLARGLSSIITVTDILVERILRRAGWEVSRIGKPHKIGNTIAVALDMPCTMDNLQRIRDKSGIIEPVLWVLPTGSQTMPSADTLGETQNTYAALTFIKKQLEELGHHSAANQIEAAQNGLNKAMLKQANG